MRDEERIHREAARWFARGRTIESEKDREKFASWLAASPAHQQAYAQIERYWRASAVIAASPIAKSSGLVPPWWHRAPKPRGLALGGGMATIAAILAVWSVPHASQPAGPIQVASAIGQIRAFDLSDGSRIILDTDSKVSIKLTSKKRHIRLDHGRARFRVAHDTQRPFVIDADHVEIVARGTVFDVDSRSQGVRVQLIEGAVDIALRLPGRPVTRSTLGPGKQVIATMRTGSISRPVALAKDAIGWPTGMLSFNNTPLRHVVAEANRYSDVKLTLADPELGELRITGAFRANAPRELASSLARMFGLRVADTGNRLSITSNGEKTRGG